MNKGIIFGLGVVLGAAGGAVTTYYIVHENAENRADEEIENYAEHCEERIARYRNREIETEKFPEEEIPEKSVDPDEEKIKHNEGVKKYHHENGLESAYGARAFTNVQSEKERKEIKEENRKVGNSKLIHEIDEELWLNTDTGYDKYTIDVDLGDDEDIIGIYGYETDNEEFVEKKFGKSIQELLNGMSYDELLEFTKNDEETGVLYLRNEDMLADFEMIIHDYREDDK